jgi:hypothetical protein
MADGHERLARLEALLRAPLPANVTFHMDWWKKQSECGTAACAVGLATMDPWFQAEGLGLEQGTSSSSWVPSFGGETMLDAVRTFFAIPYSGARTMFLMSSYPRIDKDDRYIWIVTPAMVADRIAGYLADGMVGLSHVAAEQQLEIEEGEAL